MLYVRHTAYILEFNLHDSLMRSLNPDLCISFFLFFSFGSTEVWSEGVGLSRQNTTTWATPPALSSVAYFGDRVLKAICPSCLPTSILLIYASWVARITSMSHWYLATSVYRKSIFSSECVCLSTCACNEFEPGPHELYPQP
jgi:hypothetical protein